jgi:RNA 2',3'-cyclic 3'-phosphodiesterase
MHNKNSHIRAFIAISLPEKVQIFLKDLQRQLKAYGLKASWPRPETLHLTLRFFEQIHLDKIEGVKTCMSRTAAGIPIHTLSASGLGVFPSVKNARVIWSGTKGQTDILETLFYDLSSNLIHDFGINEENKNFSPHLTVARIKNPVPPVKIIKLLEEFQGFCSKDFLVSEINFFKSELTSSGAVHEIIFSAPLKK